MYFQFILQDVLNFDLHGLMEAFPDIVDQIKYLMDRPEKFDFTLDIKFGQDGLGGLVDYQYDPKSKSYKIKQTNIMCTVSSFLQLRANSKDQELILYRNAMLNSPYGIIPVR